MPTVEDRIIEILNQPKMAVIDGVRIQNHGIKDAVQALGIVGSGELIDEVAAVASDRIPAILVQTMRPSGSIRVSAV